MKQFILLCGLLFLTGCSQPFFVEQEESITLELPQWPPQDDYHDLYPELSRWLVKTTSAGSKSSFYVLPTTATLTITVEKNAPFCATFHPLTITAAPCHKAEVSYFHPAGLIYPYNKNITWSQGYLATCMETIFASKENTGTASSHINDFLSQFNWKKAQETIDKKIYTTGSQDTIFYNPWLLDTSRFLENLCYNNFKTSFLNISGCYTYNLDFLFPNHEMEILSSFIPENSYLRTRSQISIKKDTPTLLSDGKIYAAIIKAQSAKKVSKEIIYLPIYITDI